MASVPVDLAPFDLDERMVWAFTRGIRGRIGERDLQRLVASLDSHDARVDFLGGAARGAWQGARAVVTEAIDTIGQLITTIANWTLEAYTTIYDPAVLRGLARAWLATSGPDAQRKALLDFAEVYRTRHPAGYGALTALAEVIPLLYALADWLAEPGTVTRVAMALIGSLGDLIGETWARIAALTGRPEAQGFAIGEVLGRIMMELALMMLGF